MHREVEGLNNWYTFKNLTPGPAITYLYNMHVKDDSLSGGWFDNSENKALLLKFLK